MPRRNREATETFGVLLAKNLLFELQLKTQLFNELTTPHSRMVVPRLAVAPMNAYESLSCFVQHVSSYYSTTNTDGLIAMEQIIYQQKALLDYLNEHEAVAQGLNPCATASCSLR